MCRCLLPGDVLLLLSLSAQLADTAPPGKPGPFLGARVGLGCQQWAHTGTATEIAVRAQRGQKMKWVVSRLVCGRNPSSG